MKGLAHRHYYLLIVNSHYLKIKYFIAFKIIIIRFIRIYYVEVQ